MTGTSIILVQTSFYAFNIITEYFFTINMPKTISFSTSAILPYMETSYIITICSLPILQLVSSQFNMAVTNSNHRKYDRNQHSNDTWGCY